MRWPNLRRFVGPNWTYPISTLHGSCSLIPLSTMARVQLQVMQVDSDSINSELLPAMWSSAVIKFKMIRWTKVNLFHILSISSVNTTSHHARTGSLGIFLSLCVANIKDLWERVIFTLTQEDYTQEEQLQWQRGTESHCASFESGRGR